jgi:hypothetical protein
MAGRHQPLHGADSPEGLESIDKFDTFCTYCLSSFRELRSVSLGGSTSFLCNDCYEKQQERYRQQTGGAA